MCMCLYDSTDFVFEDSFQFYATKVSGKLNILFLYIIYDFTFEVKFFVWERLV